MVTIGNVIYSIRKYLESTTKHKAVWRYPGYILPTTKPYYVVELNYGHYDIETKLKELTTQTMFITIGTYADDVVTHDKAQSELQEIAMYHSIPLLDFEGNVLGSFSIDRISGVTVIPYGVQAEDDTNSIRSYMDIRVEISHVLIKNL